MARADARSADLIVMGSHGASPLEPAHLGSVAEKVMRNALRPVLIVRDRATPAAPR
jgi:nucleotide-binding universal stress UspA family protein